MFAPGVALADRSARLNAAPAQSRKVTLMPVVARADFVDPRRSSKFAHAYHKRRLQKPALVEIVKKVRKHPVEKGPVPFGQQAKVIRVRVPTIVCECGQHLDVAAPVNLYIGDARLDQPSASKQLWPKEF